MRRVTLILEPVAQPKAVILDHARSHRVAPTDVVDRYAKGRRQTLTLIGTGCPSANRDRFNPFALQLRSLRNVFERQTSFLKQRPES